MLWRVIRRGLLIVLIIASTYFILDFIRRLWWDVVVMPIIYLLVWLLITYILYKIAIGVFRVE
jgi:hypothetical protein